MMVVLKAVPICSRCFMRLLATQSSECISPIGIQMLSKAIHEQIFGNNVSSSYTPKKLKEVQAHLKSHGLHDQPTSILPDVDFNLPQLKGENIEQHFFNITMKMTQPYIQLADRIHKSRCPLVPKEWVKAPGWHRYNDNGSIVAVPYPTEEVIVLDVETLVHGNYPVLATAVSDKAWYSWCSSRLLRDSFVYSLRPPSLRDLIPLEVDPACIAESISWKPRLLLGHNVSFDRSYIREQYLIQGTKMRFLDTMSLHIAISGFTSFQRILFNAKQKGTSNTKAVTAKAHQTSSGRLQKTDFEDFEWMEAGSMNNLNDVYKLHCDGESLQKEARDVFIHGTIAQINERFQELMTYCAQDTSATLQVYNKLWPQFRGRFPSPVTLAGMLEMNSAYLPVNKNWNRYIELCDLCYGDTQDQINKTLATVASQTCATYGRDRLYKQDPWMYDLDWEANQLKLLKNPRPSTKAAQQAEEAELDRALPTAVRKVLASANRLPKRIGHMPGVPRWYSELCPREDDPDWRPGPCLITTAKRVTPKLLKMTWDGFPLYYSDKYGWGYTVPFQEDPPKLDDGSPCAEETPQNAPLYPFRVARALVYGHDVSHKTGHSDKNMSEIMEAYAEKYSLSYKQSHAIWSRVRLMTEAQRQLFYDKKKAKDAAGGPSWHQGDGPYKDVEIPGCWFYKLPHKDGSGSNVGNPLSKDYLSKVEDGTLSSAAGGDAITVLLLSKMCSYWKNNQDRIRSQMVMWLEEDCLPTHIVSHADYNPDGCYGAILPRIVSAGTVTRRAVEKTWLTASNAKEDRLGSELKAMIQAPPSYCFVGADVDSQELWIAAVLGDAHFAGMHGSTALGWMTLQGKKSNGTDLHSKTASLIQINRDEAKIFNYGRIYGAGKQFAQKLLMQFNHRLTKEEAQAKANLMYKSTKGTRKRHTINGEEDDTYEKGKWYGGSESEMFNRLEEIAVSKNPRTPVLRCRISKALEPQNVHDSFMTSRINWVVQSSAVDYLHLMLVCMRWLFDEYHIDGRFCISIHDEVRYLVKEEDRYRAALALHLTNLYTRCMFSYKLNLNDLPQSVAFFSSVDIDKCLRKESSMNCKTPSNIHGMEGTYHILEGESLDIYTTLAITKGSLVKELESGSQSVNQSGSHRSSDEEMQAVTSSSSS